MALTHLTPPGMSNRSPMASDASMKLKGGNVNDSPVRTAVGKASKTLPDPTGNRTG